MASENFKEQPRPTIVAEPERAEEQETEIDLVELLNRLWEKIIFIALAAVAGGLIMGIYSFFIATPQYKAASKIYVVSSKDSVVNLADLQIGSYLTSDYTEVFNAWEVHEQVIQNLGLDYTYDELQSMLRIENPANTRILSIEIQHENPTTAAQISNEYAAVAREYIAEKMSMDRPNVLSVALQPDAPFAPNKTRNTVIGFVLGALLAIVVITVRFVLDDKIRSSDDIEKYTGMPTLAVVPLLNEKNLLKMQGKDPRKIQSREKGE